MAHDMYMQQHQVSNHAIEPTRDRDRRVRSSAKRPGPIPNPNPTLTQSQPPDFDFAQQQQQMPPGSHSQSIAYPLITYETTATQVATESKLAELKASASASASASDRLHPNSSLFAAAQDATADSASHAQPLTVNQSTSCIQLTSDSDLESLETSFDSSSGSDFDSPLLSLPFGFADSVQPHIKYLMSEAHSYVDMSDQTDASMLAEAAFNQIRPSNPLGAESDSDQSMSSAEIDLSVNVNDDFAGGPHNAESASNISTNSHVGAALMKRHVSFAVQPLSAKPQAGSMRISTQSNRSRKQSNAQLIASAIEDARIKPSGSRVSFASQVEFKDCVSDDESDLGFASLGSIGAALAQHQADSDMMSADEAHSATDSPDIRTTIIELTADELKTIHHVQLPMDEDSRPCSECADELKVQQQQINDANRLAIWRDIQQAQDLTSDAVAQSAPNDCFISPQPRSASQLSKSNLLPMQPLSTPQSVPTLSSPPDYASTNATTAASSANDYRLSPISSLPNVWNQPQSIPPQSNTLSPQPSVVLHPVRRQQSSLFASPLPQPGFNSSKHLMASAQSLPERFAESLSSQYDLHTHRQKRYSISSQSSTAANVSHHYMEVEQMYQQAQQTGAQQHQTHRQMMQHQSQVMQQPHELLQHYQQPHQLVPSTSQVAYAAPASMQSSKPMQTQYHYEDDMKQNDSTLSHVSAIVSTPPASRGGGGGRHRHSSRPRKRQKTQPCQLACCKHSPDQQHKTSYWNQSPHTQSQTQSQSQLQSQDSFMFNALVAEAQHQLQPHNTSMDSQMSHQSFSSGW